MNYSIHTFELRKYISNKEYTCYRDYFFTDCKGRYKVYDKDNSVIVCRFADKGIRIKLTRTKYRQYIAVIINPMEVLYSGNLIDLISSKTELRDSLSAADKMLTEYLGEEFSVDILELTRMDFCVNVRIENKEQVKSYIKLAYKTGSRKGYRVVGRKNKCINKESGFKAENKQAGTALSIYSKQDQLTYINKPADDAERILRIEFQLTKKSRIDKYTDGITANTGKIIYCFENSRACIYSILEKTIPHGRYYKLDTAMSIVNECIKNKTKRNNMIKLLKLVSKKHSVKCGIDALVENDYAVSRHYARELLKSFEKIDVNVVTIGKKYPTNTLADIYSFM